MRRYKQLEFDQLQAYFRKPLVIDLEDAAGSITVYQPSIGDIVEVGESKFYQSLDPFVSNTTAYRLFLWDSGVDWNEMSDFELFVSMYQFAEPEVYKYWLGGLDLSKFVPYVREKDDQKGIVLYDEADDIEITEDVYQYMHQYLQFIFSICPEEKITTNSVMKRWFIDKDRREMKNREYKEQHGEAEHSTLLSVISACVNHPGFKYRASELKEIGVCEFWDSVKRLQVYENTRALLTGSMSGFCDTSKIPKESFDWTRPV